MLNSISRIEIDNLILSNMQMIFEKILKNSKLYLLGVNHSCDHRHNQFIKIQESWDNFLKSCTENNKIALVEQMNVLPEETYEASIKLKGEVGAVTWLAKKNRVEVQCPEPSPEEIRRSLCEEFDSEDALYALVIQNLASWYKSSRNRTFYDAILHTLNYEQNFSYIYNFDLNKEWFVKKHKKLFGDMNMENEEFLYKIVDPRIDFCVTNDVISFKTQYRNTYILRIVGQLLNKGQCIFMVYGKGHVDVFSRLLKEDSSLTLQRI